MIRNNKRTIAVTSAVILLPLAAGLVLWNSLPDSIAIHFGVNNEPDGWCGRAMAVFGLPSLLLALHWLCVIATARDPRRENIDRKLLNVLFWICPAVSLVTSAVIYGYALGAAVDAALAATLFLGLLLLVLGNYLPKCRPNSTVGLRLSWTRDPEIWRRTHRLAGWTMTIGGVLTLAAAWLRSFWLLLVIVTASVLVPVVYAGVYYYRGKKEG